MAAIFYLTAFGVAQMLGVTEREVTKLAREHRIPYIPLPGGQLRFDRGDVAAWVDGLKRQPTHAVRRGALHTA
jgi:excisionase family DNA binding protein